MGIAGGDKGGIWFDLDGLFCAIFFAWWPKASVLRPPRPQAGAALGFLSLCGYSSAYP